MGDLKSIERPERVLFFTAPAPDGGELNTEDPLGLDYVAQQVGLRLLPGLTTRSTRAQGFAMVLYGLDLAAKGVERYGYPATEEQKRELFERWERFWALATLQSRGGPLPRNSWDVMRGVRGATAAWKPGDGELPLDFRLISRQQELGNLGAYLVPLRRSGLVRDGDTRPTPLAVDLLDAFWGEQREWDHRGRYEEYALTALSLDRKTISRKHEGLTLGAIGKMSRLSSLVELGRTAQQRRLNNALFESVRDDTTREVAALVEDAARMGTTEPRAVLHAGSRGRIGSASRHVRELLATALAFGDFMRDVVSAFDRAYAAIERGNWAASRASVAAEALPGKPLKELRAVAQALLDAPTVGLIRRLPMHGGPCVQLAEELVEANSVAALDLLLRYHDVVQRDRRRGGGWMRDEGGKLVLAITSYTARPGNPRYPSFKLDAVRTLLGDVGRLPLEVAAGVGG